MEKQQLASFSLQKRQSNNTTQLRDTTLVLRNNAVEWVECKSEEELQKLMVEMPNRYQRSASGRWVCPPGEEVARDYGFRYLVVSSAELDPIFTRNMTFMADYFDDRAPELDPQVKNRVMEVVRNRVGISIKELLDTLPGIKAEEIYFLLGKRYAFVDLHQSPIIEWEKTFVFSSQELARACRVLSGATQNRTLAKANSIRERDRKNVRNS